MDSFLNWVEAYNDPRTQKANQLYTDLRYVGNYVANPGAMKDYGDFTRKIQELYKLVGNEENSYVFKGLLSAWEVLSSAMANYASASQSRYGDQEAAPKYQRQMNDGLTHFRQMLGMVQKATNLHGYI
jgi:hypothetical protein